jgi:hypothetical protein
MSSCRRARGDEAHTPLASGVRSLYAAAIRRPVQPQHTWGRGRRLGREPSAEQREQDRHTRAEREPQDE